MTSSEREERLRRRKVQARETRVVFQGQRPPEPFNIRGAESGGRPRCGPRPGGPPSAKLDHQLQVGMFARRIAAGGQGLDLPEKRANHVDDPGEGRRAQIRSPGPIVALMAETPRNEPSSPSSIASVTGQHPDAAVMEVGNHHGAGLLPAEGNLVIGLGILARRMKTDDGQPLRRQPCRRASPRPRSGRPR